MKDKDIIFRFINGKVRPIKVTNQYMNDKIRNERKGKKVDYQKYLETRNNSIDKFIAINGIVDVLSEKHANELLQLGVPEELLPYGYAFRDDYDMTEDIKAVGKEEWVNRYIKQAQETKKRDEEYQKDKIKFDKYDKDRERAEKYLDSLNYNGEGSKKYKDYETDDVSYEIEDGTLKTITNDWGYKDETEHYFNTLDEPTTIAIGDYTSQTEHYNYAYYNNILNNNWEGEQLDEEATERIKLIDKAIDGSTIDEDMYVYRAGDIAYIDDKGEIMSKGYMSTSLFNGVESYTDSPDIFKIRVPKGTKGLYIGGNTMSWVQEYEVLFGRNTILKVLGKNNDGTIECIIIKRS